jgi:hypothetical protein
MKQWRSGFSTLLSRRCVIIVTIRTALVRHHILREYKELSVD